MDNRHTRSDSETTMLKIGDFAKVSRVSVKGLRYYDEGQFLDAVKRNDQLAVELFIASRGVNLGARTWNGRNAVIGGERDPRVVECRSPLSNVSPSPQEE